jgi:hypothetical protein
VERTAVGRQVRRRVGVAAAVGVTRGQEKEAAEDTR